MNRVPLFKICNTHLFPRVDSPGGLDAQAPPHHRHFSYHRKMKAGDLSNETLRFTVVENGYQIYMLIAKSFSNRYCAPQQHSSEIPINVAGHQPSSSNSRQTSSRQTDRRIFLSDGQAVSSLPFEQPRQETFLSKSQWPKSSSNLETNELSQA